MNARTTTRWMVTVATMWMAALGGQLATAALIDFETTPAGVTPVDETGLPSGTPYVFPGLLVSFGFDLDSNGSIDSDGLFERVGMFGTDTVPGFQGSNGPDTADTGFAGQLGNWFLKSPLPGQQFGRFVIQYSSSFPVTAASGEIWDIDGQPANGTTEEYTVQAFDSSTNLLATIVSPLGVLDTFSAPLDGKPWVFAFSGLSAGIDHIVITFTGTKPAGIGLAFNNFNPIAVPVPEPTTLTLIGGTLALGLLRVRKWRSYVKLLGFAAAMVVAVANAPQSASAGPIVDYNIPQSGSGFTFLTPSGVASGITASNLTTTGVNPLTFSNHFYHHLWNTSVNTGKYYQNTLNVASGKTLYLDDVSYSVEATQAPSTFQVRSSLDGFTSIIDSFTANGVIVTNRTTNLMSLGPITGSISFRFYASAPNPGQRMGFANHLPGGTGAGGEIPGRNIRFSGRVVPEPTTGVLMLVGGMTSLLATRRRRRG